MKKKGIISIAVYLCVLGSALAQTPPVKKSTSFHPQIPRIDAYTAYQKFTSGKALIVDAMNPSAYANYHILGAINLSSDGPKHIERIRSLRLPFPKAMEIIVYCD